MTKSISLGFTDTAIGGYASVAVTLPALNWSADHNLLSNNPGEVITTNLTSPVDQPETFRFSQRKVSNVYAGLDIDPSAYLPTRQGSSTLIELRENWVETDSVDAMYRKIIPVRCGISFTLPSYGNVTAAMALELLYRTLSAAFEQGVTDETGMAALLRGVMVKKTL